MNVAWGLLAALSLLSGSESWCSPTTYYQNCWIRRFPGIFIDLEESQRRGARLLNLYQEETALKCSRTCCLTQNFSCNLAAFQYETSPERQNCFHLHCPTLESCILTHRGNVVLYNITKGADPDLLVFGKYFSSNVRVLPHHYSRINASDALPSDKRQFIRPAPAVPPLTSAATVKPPASTGAHATAAEEKVTAVPSAASMEKIPATLGSSQDDNDTAGSLERNHTAGSEEGQGGEDEDTEFGPGWRMAAHTLLVAVVICVTVLLSCCCSILLLVSWRGQKKRMGRYRTSWRGKKGSMRLIKYVLVRESC
ncbi:MANSC domain-containing protein 4 isoform X2 [Oryzias latipes]|uniref:MANSC domain-containing protein n=1 Tax=Oryzias latipes TaxID=8090 RepID=A0A3B3HD52_ORYLA|nr:MANSC domain-containing protein 4 isoform X2 [Oryzias latipes]